MGGDQPVVSISFAQQELGRLSESPSLADIASLYLQAIRSTQPTGHYYLGGYCAAGIAAYEAALQLMAEGQDVPLLVMIDAPSPAQWRSNIDRSRLRHHFEQLISRRGIARWSYALDLLRRGRARLATPRHRQEFREPLDRAVLGYKTPPYPGAVALFQPLVRTKAGDFKRGWPRLIKGEFLAFDCPGDHYNLITPPYVNELGAKMGQCLTRFGTASAVRDGKADNGG